MYQSEELDWEYVKTLVHPGTTENAYHRSVVEGIEDAKKILEHSDPSRPTVKLVCDIHRAVFKEVYPFAGNVREERVAWGLFNTAPPERIEPELRETNERLEELLEERDFEHRAVALASYNARLMLIHPFQDGNTRVSNLLTEAQRSSVLGLEKSSPFLHGQYREALSEALERNDVKPLLRSVLQVDSQEASLAPTIPLELNGVEKLIDVGNEIRAMSESLARELADKAIERGRAELARQRSRDLKLKIER